MDRLSLKIVLLGEGRVGKTSLVVRYCQSTFNDKEQSTVQASHLTKRLTIGDCNVNLNVWDTAGQERFHALGPIYYRDADGALLVYDITDVDSFARVKNWVKELRKIVGDDISICIAGNKKDLQKNAHVTEEEADAYAASVGAQHIRTSAKLDQGVNEVFLALVQKVVDKKRSDAGPGGRPNRPKKKSLLLVQEEPDGAAQNQPLKQTEAAGGCC